MQKLKDTIENLSSNKRNEENFKLNARHLKHKIGLSLRTHCSTKLKLANKIFADLLFFNQFKQFFCLLMKTKLLSHKNQHCGTYCEFKSMFNVHTHNNNIKNINRRMW
uniref:Uncharacterized protein n=1 Tax=Cacopsylla melanoneura TaxID=428564 RepID=A0A8D9AMH9_9HEMI